MKDLFRGPTVQAIVIVLMTLAVYLPAMQGGFIWDDDLFLTHNPLIKADDGLYRFWFTKEPPDYFPLVSTSLWLEWRLWGMNPAGYHVVNIAWHAMSAVLTWLVLRRLNIPGAWLAAVLFAVHPVNVESVAWITERKNTQPMVFYLMTLLFYLEFDSSGKKQWYMFALLAFVLALLSKTSVVMLPFVLLGCVWWQRESIGKRDLMRVIPFFLVSVALGLVTVWYQRNAIGGDIIQSGGLLSRVAGAGWTLWFYVYKAIFPYKLSFVYPRWELDTSSIVSYVPGLIMMISLGLFWRHRDSWGKAPLFAFGYFVVTLFPVLGFFDINFMRYSFVTDHWQYTSITGIIAFIVGIGVWFSKGLRGQRRQLVIGVAVAVVCLFSIMTWVRCYAFKDPEALWRDTISKNPQAWLAHNNLGTLLLKQGRPEEAFAHFSEALRLHPSSTALYYNLGLALLRQGRNAEAIDYYYKVLQINPNFVEAHRDLGSALMRPGRFNEAITHCFEVVRLMPNDAQAQYNLANLLSRQGKMELAIVHYLKALEIRPDFAEGHYNLGNILSDKGRLTEATRHYSEALRIRPGFLEAHNNLGTALYRQGKPEEAITHFREVLRMDPGNKQAQTNLETVLDALDKND